MESCFPAQKIDVTMLRKGAVKQIEAHMKTAAKAAVFKQ